MQTIASDATILIVDDNHESLRTLTSILRDHGHTVRPVPDIQQALTTIETKLPDLIVLDSKLPKFNGAPLSQHLQADTRTRHIPLLFICALNEPDDRAMAFARGGADYLSRPFQVEEVIARVTTHISLHRLQARFQEQNNRLETEKTRSRQLEEDSSRRDTILEAIGETVQSFLKTASVQQHIPIFLERVGRVTGVSRVSLFSLQTGQHGVITAREQENWVSAGQKALLSDHPDDLIRDFARWNMRLSQGLPISGHVTSFPTDEQRILQQQHIRSILVIPIFVEQEWWGFLELDVCPVERAWSSAEVEMLRAVASILGTAIERERAQQALKESEARFRTIAEFTYDWEYWMAPNGNYLYVSPSCERITGYPPEAFLANPDLLLELVHPDDRKQVVQHLQEEIKLYRTQETRFRILTRNGEEHWISHACQSVYDAEGQWLGRRASNRLITEQVMAQQALYQSEERYRVTSELVSDYAYALRVEADQTLVLEWMTAAFERITGFTPGEMEKAGGWLSLVHPDDTESFQRHRQRLLSGSPSVCEFRIMTQENETRWLREHGRSDHDGQHVIRLYCAAQDITERRWAEEAFLQSYDRLEERVAQRTEELGLVERELRRVNRALKTLSACNQVIVRATDETELMNAICQTFIQVGEYRLAWIGYAQHDESRRVVPVAQSGYENGYLETLDITWDDTERGKGPTGTAIRTRQPCVVRNILEDPNYQLCRNNALKRGYASSISLPLAYDSDPENGISLLGALNIYASELDAFDPEEIALLSELADDLTYGIVALRTRLAHRKTTARLANILDIAANAIIAIDSDGCIILFNPAAEITFGYRKEEIMGQPFTMLLMPSSLATYQDYVQEVRTMTTGQRSGYYYEMAARRRDGRSFPAEVSLAASHQNDQTTFTVIVRDITDQKQAEEDLIASHEQIRNILESITDAFFSLDFNWQFVYVNQEAEKALLRSRDELVGHNVWELFAPAVETAFYRQYHDVMVNRVPVSFEEYYAPLETWYDVRAYPSKDGMTAYFRNINERKQAEEEYRRVNRALKTLSECNQALVHATSEHDLLQRICQLIVERGGYRMAWVGFAETQGQKRVIPIAQAGHEEGYLKLVDISWSDTSKGQGPAATAIRTGQPHIVKDIQSDEHYPVWRNDAIKRGYTSAIGLPILYDTQAQGVEPVVGALVIYAPDQNAFDSAEVELLSEMANDLAYGIASLRVREEHHRVEELLRYQKTLLECQTEAAIDGILVTSRERDWLSYNRRFVEIWGIPEEVVESRSGSAAMKIARNAVVNPDAFLARVLELHGNTTDSVLDEVELLDGRTLERYTAPVRDAQGVYYGRVWFYRDITERQSLFKQLQSAHERLQMLSRRLVEVQEQERRHIARELHDEVGQALTGLHLILEIANRQGCREIDTQLHEAQLLVNDLMSRVRDLSLDLRPAMLDDLGLLPTLRWFFGRYTTQTGIHVHFRHADVDCRFPPEIETVVYRLIQESLTNVARYAGVSDVTVRLWSDEVSLGLQLEDLGAGFDLESTLEKNTSSGLAGMQERVALVDGELTIESAPGAGTCISADLPLVAVGKLTSHDREGVI